MPVRGFALLIVAACTVPAPAEGFDCAPLAPSPTRQPAYRAVSGAARCEGFFEKKISQPFIELVSLTRGTLPPAGDAAAAAALELRADSRADARLVIQPQRSGPFYRVDAALPAGQALRWDPAPMLAATGLRLADLGFLALLDTAGPVLAPVLLAEPERGRATAVVRVSVAVSSLAWRGYRLGPKPLPAGAWRVLPNSQLFAWQRLALPIALPDDGGGLTIDVQAIGADDGRALPLLQFAIGEARDAGP